MKEAGKWTEVDRNFLVVTPMFTNKRKIMVCNNINVAIDYSLFVDANIVLHIVTDTN